MNIFILDENPERCAEQHCDKHVVKMTLECAQILSAVNHMMGRHHSRLYNLTHQHHPCVVWAASCTANYVWLHRLFQALATEYVRRYPRKGRQHASWIRLGELTRAPPRGMVPRNRRTPFVQCVPKEHVSRGDPVTAYRTYYINQKASIARWTNREVPSWFAIGIQLTHDKSEA